jgi:hypothetical protein
MKLYGFEKHLNIEEKTILNKTIVGLSKFLYFSKFAKSRGKQ